MTRVLKVLGMMILSGILLISCVGVAVATEKTKKPWNDWPDTDIEAGWWVKNEGIYEGYPDETYGSLFHPNGDVTPLHFVTIMRRAGIEAEWPTTIPATIGDALKYLPNTVLTSKPTDKLTRYRLAVMLYRHFVSPLHPDANEDMIKALDDWFQETKVTWHGVTRQTKFVGYGELFLALAEEHNVPIWLALGQCWRESQWFTTGISVDYNCGWGMKDKTGRWGTMGSPTHVKGYTNYISVEEAINAYFRLMDSPDMPYRALINEHLQTGSMTPIYEALDIYAPGYENDTVQHHKIVNIVKGWCEDRGIK